MAFFITYTSTAGVLSENIDLLPGNSNLTKRTRLTQHTKTILLIDKIEIALLILANFIWDIETASPDFFEFQVTEERTELQERRSTLFNVLRPLINNRNERIRLSAILLGIVSSKRNADNTNFIVPFDLETPHDFSSISDESIASLIQEVVVDKLENTIKLL